jgi:hypothetical protein
MTNTTPAKFDEFVDYCREFYDLDRSTLYPFATEDEIRNACLAHVTDRNPPFPFDGDTMDREAVRDRILAGRAIVGLGETDFEKAIVGKPAPIRVVVDLV